MFALLITSRLDKTAVQRLIVLGPLLFAYMCLSEKNNLRYDFTQSYTVMSSQSWAISNLQADFWVLFKYMFGQITLDCE